MDSSCRRRGFTIVELLAVVAILTILMVVTFIVINPPQLLAQSRDARRMSDLATANTAVALYQSINRTYTTFSLGSSSVAYLSVPDPAATSTAGDACTGLSMVSTTGYAYHCAASTSYLNASTTGWIPVNFQNIPGGSPFGTVPVDPKNQTSSNLYYTYETNGTQWTLSTFFESQKYAKTMQTMGGNDPTLYEVGTGITTLPQEGRGLVGYWPFNEGTGSSTIDYSGANTTGTWSGTPGGSSGYYSSGKVGPWAGTFAISNNDYVSLGSNSVVASGTPFSASVWANFTTVVNWPCILLLKDAGGNPWELDVSNVAGYVGIDIGSSAGWARGYTNVAVTTGAWMNIVATYNGGPQGSLSSYALYLNGVSQTLYTPSTYGGHGNATDIGFDGANYLNGYLDDVRIYNRALSSAEVQEIYSAEK